MQSVQRTFTISHITWLSLLSLALIYLFSSLRIVSDITQFMPDNHQDKNVQLLMDELQQGNTARLLIFSIQGSDSEKLASISRELKTLLSANDDYSLVNNGEQLINSSDFISGEYKRLYDYRYLLSANAALTKIELERSLQQRLSELRSGITFFKDTLATDPQNHFLQHLKQLSQRANTTRHHGVWFDKTKTAALILVELNLKTFSLDQQELLINNIKKTIHKLSEKHASGQVLHIDITGTPSIAVKTRSAIKSTTQWLSSIALSLMFLLFWWSYRSFRLFFIAMLPLSSSVIVALTVTNLLFQQVHGIIIAFGITLLGVCLDYPVHLFSHHTPSRNPQQTILSIWPTLRLGVITTALAYLAMLGTGFAGLSQLSIFAISGLFTALLVTRWITPHWLAKNITKPEHNYLTRLSSLKLATNGKLLTGILLIIFCNVVLVYNQKTVLSNNISDLSPVPPQVKQLDKKLRLAVGAPDVNHVFILKDKDAETLLQQSEQLKSKLGTLQSQEIVKNIFSVTDLIPSKKTQELNQALLPERQALLNNLASAASNTPFKKTLFRPFVNDIEKSKTLKPLDIETVINMPPGKQIQQDFFFRNNQWVSIIRLSGVKDEKALLSWLNNKPGIQPYYLNLRQATSALMSGYQQTALSRLLLGSIIIGLILFFVRPASRVVNILVPVLLAVLLSVSIQVLLGTSLTLFHILALLLIVGIGLDYSLFFDRDWTSTEDYLQRLHGIFISAISTLITFGILSFSDIPVLSALGQTVSFGVLGCFILTLIFNMNNRQKA